MARSAPALVAVFVLVPALLLAIAAAQGPPLPPTNPSDAAALHAVFRQWRLEGDAAAEDPCGKGAWSGSFAVNASVGCDCSSGVECRITQLNVTGYRNITEIPPALFNLTELVTLDLSNNYLSGSVPREVGNLSKLETWHFNNNNLSGYFPHESSLLRNLKSLWMFDNYIEGPIPEFIQNLTNLTDLRLYGMKLQGPIPQNVSKLINLENLMLGDLEGNYTSFDFVENWANLSTLSLRKCGLTGQLLSPPRNLPKLKYLDLTSNNLSGSIKLLLQYKDSLNFIYVGNNSLSERLPPEIIQPSVPLDVSYNPSVNGTLRSIPAGQKWPINYIGTSVDANGTINSGSLTILNCLRMQECNGNDLTDHATSFAINCGGKETSYSDRMPTVFSEDSTDLGGAGFHVNTTSHWVVSHVGSDPFSKSPGIVQDILDTDMLELYKTARTSTGALRYYVVGLANGKYTVQLFFAEIVIVDGPGRRVFDIDIQDRNIRKDFDIAKEAGGSRKPTNITHEVIVDNSILVIHLYWSGRGTCCIPYEGAYGPLVSAIKVTHFQDPKISPPQAPHSGSSRQDEKRRGIIAGIAALCIAAAVISSSVVYLWWKWVSLVKRSMA
ncbi:probable LRR receptor-like serine/threonine-protein kinase At1g56130 isoform X1 [Panicum virgatum]|uniref:non-specific serine/threonine protein kinase n=1 Tax=Panicum virgatum TaxID=38727 RepID=A0A8T0THG7_PANVG|nr:probable LRR receptor-like serine/threonine-protein kinase At1g56130 isoform X1 [Panicum virgatum]KAG2609677.1 hypothetical protein PVAP13_4KG062400 [Panicum virgatum]